MAGRMWKTAPAVTKPLERERISCNILNRSMNVCGAMRTNRCIPLDLELEGRHLKKGHSALRRKGDIMVQMW